MTLVPLLKLGRLAEPDALIWLPEERDAVRVILKTKDCEQPMPLAELRALQFTFASLVVLHAEWEEGHPVLSYGVEDLATGPEVAQQRHPDETITLYRFADEARKAGEWWSARAFIARQEGGGRHHDDPRVWTITVPRSRVLFESICRFGKQFSPPEYVVDTDGLDIEPHL